MSGPANPATGSTPFGEIIKTLANQLLRIKPEENINGHHSRLGEENWHWEILAELVRRQEKCSPDAKTNVNDISIFEDPMPGIDLDEALSKTKPKHRSFTWANLYCLALLVWTEDLHNKPAHDGTDYRNKDLNVIAAKWFRYLESDPEFSQQEESQAAWPFQLTAAWVFEHSHYFNEAALKLIRGFSEFSGKPGGSFQYKFFFKTKMGVQMTYDRTKKDVSHVIKSLPISPSWDSLYYVPHLLTASLVDKCGDLKLGTCAFPRVETDSFYQNPNLYETTPKRADTPFSEEAQSVAAFPKRYQTITIKGPEKRDGESPNSKWDGNPNAGQSGASTRQRPPADSSGREPYPFFPQE